MFDVVVGNPPYQESTYGNDPSSNRVSGKRNLYDSFMFLADTLVNEYWALVVPSFWLGRPAHKLYKSFLSRCDYLINTSSFFNIVGVDTCALLVSKNHTPNTTIVNGGVTTVWPSNQIMGFVDRDLSILIQKCVAGHQTMDSIHFQCNDYVRSKIIESDNGYPIVDITGNSNDRDPVYKYSTTPFTQRYLNTPRLVLNWNGSKTGIGAIKKINLSNAAISASCVALVCDSESECENMLSVLNSQLYRFIVRCIKTSATNNKATFKYLPMIDFSRSWTDEELYEHFNLTQEEIDLIEQ